MLNRLRGMIWVIGIVIGIVILTACARADAANLPTEQVQAQPPTLPPTWTPIATLSQPTETPTDLPTPSPAPANLPDRIVDDHGSEMVLIPEGEFIMGSEAGFPDEMPVHTVWVDSFYIDLLEVTNREYQDCVEDGGCEEPRRTDCCTENPNAFVHWPEYFGNPEFDTYPVIFITWFDALDYCTWRGARLATEAEWEKASRGTDGRTYPWGSDEPTPDHLNFTWPHGTFGTQRPLYTTSPVGSYPLGASPYGVLDLAGNVYEWLWDRYEADYYQYSPDRNPTGPETGDYRLTRGGSFYNQAFRNRSANRNNAYIPATSFHFDGGARCATDIPGKEPPYQLP